MDQFSCQTAVVFHRLGLRAGNARLSGPGAGQKNAGNVWTEQIPLVADRLHREAKFRSKSKHRLAKGEGEAGENR